MAIKQTELLNQNISHTPLMWAALEGDLKTVQTLLSRRADVNICDGEGRTALMFAVVNLHSEIVNALLKYGVDVNVRAKDGGTAIMLASSCGDAEIVQMLLENGADSSGHFIMTGQTAALLAAEKGYTSVVELLESATANARITSSVKQMAARAS